MMSHLDRSLLPPAKGFYEGEGFKLARPNSTGWCHAVGQPPCHVSRSGKSFSTNLHHGGWHCFGCGQHGDQITYIQIRDGCDFLTACKVLGIYRGGLTDEERREIDAHAREREWFRRREEQREADERQKRIEFRRRLHRTVKTYLRAADRLREVGPDSPESEDLWATLASALEVWRIEESEYSMVCGLDDPWEIPCDPHTSESRRIPPQSLSTSMQACVAGVGR